MVQKVKDAFLMERELQKTFGIECCDSIDGFKDFVFLNRFGKVHNNGTLNKALRTKYKYKSNAVYSRSF